MNENDKSRSGLQTAVDFAHAARAAKRIMQAAAASGVHGAAAATAREAFPLLLKVLIAVLVVFIAVPMVIFTALPNIFFGYNSSGTDTVIQMTQQAMTLGGVYMTLGNFEGAQIDSVVTGIAAEYEKNGTTIDHIVVSSAMTDDDLLWAIAINSAAHQQDLNTMSADLIRDFCKSSLSYGEAYHCLHAPIHLLSCDETGAQQLQIMTVPDYRVKLTRLMLRSAYQPPPEDIAAWDGLYNGHPFVIGADMDLRRIDTAVRTAKQHGCLPIALAALEGQGSAVLLQRYADPGCATVYKVTENVLSELLGRAPNLYVPPHTQFLTEKGDVVDAPLIKAPGKAGGPHRK